MNVREIAKKCGVCPATVSRVLTGQGAVKAETRDKILKVVEESGYRPPPKRKERKRVGQNIIAVLLPQICHSFFNAILYELNSQIFSYGKRLIIIPMDLEHPLLCLEELCALAPSGIILLEESMPDDFWEALPKHIPTVMCGALSLNRRYPAVHIDDLSAAYDAVNYLVGLGHKSIAFIAEHPNSISSGFQRMAGFQKAMQDQGLRIESENIVYISSGTEQGYAGMMQLLEQSHRFTAVFACSDEAAMGAMAALQDKKLQVPEDISVMGFDDCIAFTQVRPMLTTLHQPIHEIAERTLQILMETKKGTLPPVTSVTLPHFIAERASCRRIGKNPGASKGEEK